MKPNHPWWHYFFTHVDMVETITVMCIPRHYETKVHLRCTKCKVKWTHDPDEGYVELEKK